MAAVGSKQSTGLLTWKFPNLVFIVGLKRGKGTNSQHHSVFRELNNFWLVSDAFLLEIVSLWGGPCLFIQQKTPTHLNLISPASLNLSHASFASIAKVEDSH